MITSDNIYGDRHYTYRQEDLQYYSITKVKYYLKSLKTWKLKYLTSTADLRVNILDVH